MQTKLFMLSNVWKLAICANTPSCEASGFQAIVALVVGHHAFALVSITNTLDLEIFNVKYFHGLRKPQKKKQPFLQWIILVISKFRA